MTNQTTARKKFDKYIFAIRSEYSQAGRPKTKSVWIVVFDYLSDASIARQAPRVERKVAQVWHSWQT